MKKNIMDKYMDIFNFYSWNNEMFGKLTFHAILGQLLRHKSYFKGGLELDPRISVFLVQDSGSGKSTAYECIGRILRILDLKYLKMDEPNDAALVGTQEAVQTKDDDGDICQEYTQTTGALAWANMILVDEGVVLLQTKKHGKGVLVILQTALNPIGSEANRYEKRMAHGDPIIIHPECSLIITSIMPPGLDTLALTGGFLQRILLFPRWLTDRDRIMNAMKDIELLGIVKKTKRAIEDISRDFEEIYEYYENYDIAFPNEVKPYIKQLVKKLFQKIEKTDVNIKPILLTFLSRYQNFMYTLAYHYCAMELRTKVTTRDFDKAYKLIDEIFGEIAFWLESTLKTSKMENKLRSYKIRMLKIFEKEKYKKAGYISKVKLVKELSKLLKVSNPTARSYIKEFKKRKVLNEADRKIFLKKEE